MIGFFEESSGVRSMSRLTIFLMALYAGAVVAATCVYLLRAKQPEAAVIMSMAGFLTPLIVKGAVAIIKRGQGEDAEK